MNEQYCPLCTCACVVAIEMSGDLTDRYSFSLGFILMWTDEVCHSMVDMYGIVEHACLKW